MRIAERIRRLEEAMAKQAQGVDPLAYYLAQYRDALATMAPADASACHAFITTGAGEVPLVGNGVISSTCTLERYFPGLLDRLPGDWRDEAAFAQLIKTEPPRRRETNLGALDDNEPAQLLIERLERELEEETGHGIAQIKD